MKKLKKQNTMNKRSIKLTNLTPGTQYYGFLVSVDRWCNENCEGKWWHKINYTYIDGEKKNVPDMTHYIFQKPTDAMAFKLRWI